MENLLDLANCSVCKETFDEPIFLPCYQTICSKHLPSNAFFECCICKNYHLKPKNGFPTNMKALETVKAINEFINKNEPNKQEAKRACDQLENNIKEAESLTSNPCQFLDEYFENLTNEIDSAKKEFIQIIVEKHKEIIKKVNEIKEQCKNDSKEIVIQLEENVANTKHNLNEGRKLFGIVKPTPNERWKNITQEANHGKEEIKHLFEKTKNDLLQNKQYEFCRRIIWDGNNFGDLIIKNKMKITNWSHSKNYSPQLFSLESTNSLKPSLSRISPPTIVSDKPSLSELFKSDKWICTGCYMANKKEDQKCICCETLKHVINRNFDFAIVPDTDESLSSRPNIGSFTFGKHHQVPAQLQVANTSSSLFRKTEASPAVELAFSGDLSSSFFTPKSICKDSNTDISSNANANCVNKAEYDKTNPKPNTNIVASQSNTSAKDPQQAVTSTPKILFGSSLTYKKYNLGEMLKNSYEINFTQCNIESSNLLPLRSSAAL